MSASRLIFGVVALVGLYAVLLVGGVLAFPSHFLELAVVEGAAFSLVLLWAHRESRIGRWIALSAVGAALNAMLVLLWPIMTSIPEALFRTDLLPLRLATIVTFAFYSSAGALVYAWAVDALLQPRYFGARTYLLAVSLCALAGIPVDLGSIGFLVLHKGLWWTLFALSLLIASGMLQQAAANDAMEQPRAGGF